MLHHVNCSCLPQFSFFLNLSVTCWLAVGRLSVTCRSTDGQQLTDSWPTGFLGSSSSQLPILLAEFNRFPELSRTSGIFPGLSSPGKCNNKIPGLSRFSRTHRNPVYTAATQCQPILLFTWMSKSDGIPLLHYVIGLE